MNKIINKLKSLQGNYETNIHIKSFFKNNSKKQSNDKKVLIYAGIGHIYVSYFEVLMYHLLKKEGYDVDYLVYDQNIPINEVLTKHVIETVGKEKSWIKTVANTKKLLNNANIKPDFINAKNSEVVAIVNSVEDDLDSIYNFQLEGVLIGEIVKGTMYRYYKSLTFDKDAIEVAKKFLFTALTNYFEIKERTKKKAYDFVLFSHGIYVTWEPVVAFCKQNNINFICYDRAKTKNTININFNQASPDWSFDTAWTRYKDKDLNVKEQEQVKKYLEDRELQTNDVYAYNLSKRSDNINNLKEKLGIPLNKKVITIFTNLIWDAANVSRDVAFENAFECVTKTIEYYKDNSNVQIVLRSHPAEKVIGTKERYGDLVKNYFNNQIPENVIIIEPEMAINSFSVIDMSDIGVVNTSTVGLEFALLGKPIILISETHYRNKEFTYDVDSQASYFSTLDDLVKTPKLKKNQVALAEKYFYMMMFEYQHKVPLKYEDNGNFKKYSFDHIDKIPKDNIIYNIIDRINEKDYGDFVFWD